jgi:acetyl-CoA carboxylase biotin carboxyl carrier protein
MNIEDLKQLLTLVREHELVEFELEQDGVKLRIRKDSMHGPVVAPMVGPVLMAPPTTAGAVVPAGATPGLATPQGQDTAADAEGLELAVMKSPIVGTFYRSPSPGAPSFVEVGTIVRKGQVLCIIEAMKLMNEIESEYDGEVVTVYVENGQPVQYGERLFAIKAT